MRMNKTESYEHFEWFKNFHESQPFCTLNEIEVGRSYLFVYILYGIE